MTILCATISLLAGCATKYYLNPNISDKQDLIYDNGRPIVRSWQRHSSIDMFVEKTEQEELRLHMLVRNDNVSLRPTTADKYRILFSPHAIKIWGEDDDNEPESLYVFPPEQYLRKMKNEQQMELVGEALSGAMEAQRAGHSTATTTTSVNASVYGSGGYATGWATGTSTTHSYDAGKVAEVQARNRDRLERHAAEYAAALNATENGLLKITTLQPKEYVEGNVFAEYDDKKHITANVPVGKDMHQFVFATQPNAMRKHFFGMDMGLGALPASKFDGLRTGGFAFDFDLRWRCKINKHVAWDIVNIKMGLPFMSVEDEDIFGAFLQATTGICLFTNPFGTNRTTFYVLGRGGYSMFTTIEDDVSGSFKGPCFEFGLGFHFMRKYEVGVGFNYATHTGTLTISDYNGIIDEHSAKVDLASITLRFGVFI
jgi:hypothetical protein